MDPLWVRDIFVHINLTPMNLFIIAGAVSALTSGANSRWARIGKT